MSTLTINEKDAPEGYVAVLAEKPLHCRGCDFRDLQNEGGCTHHGGVSCMPDRKDGQIVIFKKIKV